MWRPQAFSNADSLFRLLQLLGGSSAAHKTKGLTGSAGPRRGKLQVLSSAGYLYLSSCKCFCYVAVCRDSSSDLRAPELPSNQRVTSRHRRRERHLSRPKANRSGHAVQLEEVKQRSSTRQVHLRADCLLMTAGCLLTSRRLVG